MNVTIIGSGSVGKTLALGFKKHGHKTSISTRNLEGLKDWALTEGAGIQLLSLNKASENSDILVLAVKGVHAQEVLNSIGANALKNKIVIDTCNPISNNPPKNGVLEFFTQANDSLMEQLQKAFPDTHFVKAFNSIGAHLMVNPQFSEGKVCMPICGNNNDAKLKVSVILKEFGFDILDLGSVEAARPIESLCILWCIPGFQHNDWVHGFQWLRK